MTPASPSTATTRWGSPASTRHAGQGRQLPGRRVGARRHRPGLLPDDWRLFLPESWDDRRTTRRRRRPRARQVRHRQKWQLALDMLDELAGWGLVPPVVVADAGYGDVGEFRLGLERARAGLRGAGQGHHQRLPRGGRARGRRPTPGGAAARGRATATAASSLRAAGPGRRRSRRPRRSPGAKGQHAASCARGSWPCGSARPGSQLAAPADGRQLPVRWLLAEWPAGQPEPVKYWLSSLPADTPLEELVRLAKLRWRVEHDYRELKDGLGLDHFEGRSFGGLAPPRDPGRRSPTPSSPCSGWTQKRLRRPDHLYQVLRELQLLLACWAGACPLCQRKLPRSTPWLHPSAHPT